MAGVGEGFVVVGRGFGVGFGDGFGLRVVTGRVEELLGLPNGIDGSTGARNRVEGGTKRVAAGTGDRVDAVTKVPTRASAGALVTGDDAIVVDAIVVEVVETVDVVDETGIVTATALNATLNVVVGASGIEVEATAVETGLTNVDAGEPDCCTSIGFGSSLEPTPEANRPPTSRPAKAAIMTNLRRPERTFGNPSARQESERSAEVPVSE